MMTRARKIFALAGTAVLIAGCGVASGHESNPGHSSYHGGSQSASSSATSSAATGSTAGSAASGTANGAAGHDHHDGGASSSAATGSTGAATTAPPAAVRPGTVKVIGTPVENLRTDAAPPETSNFCDQSDLPAGEGKADKGNTCVSTPLGEIADHPVRVAANPRSFFNIKGGKVKVRVLIADNLGVLDLNAFTFDQTGGAGITLHERPAELQDNGRPLLHCHIGITTVKNVGALPGEDYDAAFSGLQGFKGDLTAEITGLPRGTYRGDVYCSGPGHPMLPTSKATEVQAFDTFDFKVIGR